MTILVILIIAALIGGVCGRQLKKKNIEIKGYSTIQAVTVFILIFFMGTKIGSDERILESIRDIGVSAVVVTIATMGGSLLVAYGLRKLLKMNKEGVKSDD